MVWHGQSIINTVELFDFDAIVLQINIKDITKRQLRLAVHLKIDHDLEIFNLKLIDEKLWCCHVDGITVYDCQWKKLREFSPGKCVRSVAALDTKTVVIATQYRGLVISSISGRNVRGTKCIFS